MTIDQVKDAKVRLSGHGADAEKRAEFNKHAPSDLNLALLALERVRAAIQGHPDNSIVLVSAVRSALNGP